MRSIRLVIEVCHRMSSCAGIPAQPTDLTMVTSRKVASMMLMILYDIANKRGHAAGFLRLNGDE